MFDRIIMPFIRKAPETTETKVKPVDLTGLTVKEVIEQIHSEFGNAGEQLLKDANEILAANSNICSEKADRLKSLGFTSVPEVKQVEEKIQKKNHSEETIQLVQTYKMKYPNYKFITEEMVQQICKKYNLVCGDIGAYKGFVPVKNVSEIEAFLKQYTFDVWTEVERSWTSWDHKGQSIDMSNYEIRSSTSAGYYHFYPKDSSKENYKDRVFQSENRFEFYGSGTIDGKYYHVSSFRKASMKICAPVKDMEISERQRIVDGYKIIDWPDPVILQPITGGYLIVTAWGDESSDPLVVNESLN